MPVKKVAIKNNRIDKETMLQEITGKLHTALPVLKEQLGEKKFDKRIKKAAKLLVAGIKKTPVKKTEAPAKKIASPIKKAATGSSKK